MATTIKALKGFSDGEVSLYPGEVRSIDNTKAAAFISAGLAESYTAPITPSGSISITANGVYDVTEKASATVNVGIATVTYNVNGGTGTVDAVTAIKGNTISLSDGTGITPAAGKAFVGWATTADATEADVTSPYTVTGDVTLYAVYNRVSYIVTYDVNGGTGSVTSAVVTIGESVALNDGAGITPPDTKTFKGWGLSSDATEVLESPYTPEDDVTLYAVYE